MPYRLKKLYKKYMSPVIDATGLYDKSINHTKGKYIVPLYHRIISTLENDPYELGMCVKKDNFNRQLEYFKNNFSAMTVCDYIDKDKSTHNGEDDYISLTFDDGYKDTVIHALPSIQKFDLTASVYICGYSLTEETNFWWDTVINCFAETKIKYLDYNLLKIDGLSGKVRLTRQNKEKNVIRLLKSLWSLNTNEIVSSVARIQDVLMQGGLEKIVSKMTASDIKYLYSQGVEIGSHTMTHPDLTKLNKRDLKKELLESKGFLEEIIGDKIYGFAYPAGFYNREVADVVKECGYMYSLSTDSGVNDTVPDFNVKRVSMPDTNISDLKRSLAKYSRMLKKQ